MAGSCRNGRADAAALPALQLLRVGRAPAAADVPGVRVGRAGLRGERGGGDRLLVLDRHAREGAYDVSLVDLDEGYRVMTTVTGGGVIGARVRGRVEDADDGPRLVFDP
jgi:hypothetical protein